MTWLSPAYAVIAASIAVPSLLILYFLKLRRRDVEVSTTLLWKKAIQDLQANAPFQRLRRNILLLLQLLVLGGVITALGQPQTKRQQIAGSRHILLIDRSGSMNSMDESGDKPASPASRLDAAKKQAIAVVESLREGGLFDKDRADEAMVIAFDTQADIRQQFTSDKNLLRRAIEGITATDGPTAIAEAMRLAKAQAPKRIVEGQAVEGLTAGPPETIHIFSDGRLPDATQARPGPEDSVEFHRLGSADAANIAVTGIRSERGYDNPGRLSIFVSLQNNRPEPRTVDVELLINDEGRGIKSTTIPGAAKAEQVARTDQPKPEAGAPEAQPVGGVQLYTPGVGGVVFSLDQGEGAIARVRLRQSGTDQPLSDDVLALDDSAWIVVPPARKLAVALVSAKGDLFLESALAGLPLSRLTPLTPEQFRQKSDDGTLGEYDVIILSGWLPESVLTPPTGTAATPAPADAAAAPAAPTPAGTGEGLPAGRYLIFGGAPLQLSGQPTGIRDLGTTGASSIVDWRRDHPMLRGISLDGLDIAQSRKLEVASGGATSALAWSDSGPIIMETSAGDVRAVVVPFSPAESDWPFQVSFVVFLAQSTQWLGDDGGAGATARLVQPGAVLTDRLPSGAVNVSIKAPDGETTRLTPASDGRIVFGPLGRVGVYETSWTGPAGPTDARDGDTARRYYAVGLLDPAESDLASQDRVELATAEVAALARGSRQADRKLWPWLLLAALTIVMVEWFVYNKKVHV